VIVVVIDGCRLDRFREARKPYLEKMMAGGTSTTAWRPSTRRAQ
jgi:hypothetical protein